MSSGWNPDETQRIELCCELCGRLVPLIQADGWFEFHRMSDKARLYACPECFDPQSKRDYSLMFYKLTEPQPPHIPLTLRELGLDE